MKIFVPCDTARIDKVELQISLIEVPVVSRTSLQCIALIFPRLCLETSCRANLCKPDERCVLSKQSRPVCIVCEFPPRFFTHSGECSMNIPVCGDNGQLYENYCSILRHQCEKNQYINIIEYQTCPSRIRKNFSTKKLKYFGRYPDFRLQ